MVRAFQPVNSGRSWVRLPLGNSKNLFPSIWFESISTFIFTLSKSQFHLSTILVIRYFSKKQRFLNLNESQVFSCLGLVPVFFYIFNHVCVTEDDRTRKLEILMKRDFLGLSWGVRPVCLLSPPRMLFASCPRSWIPNMSQNGGLSCFGGNNTLEIAKFRLNLPAWPLIIK